MAVGQYDGPMPLYMHTLKRILQEMRISQQQLGTKFNYREFKKMVMESGLTPAQLEPLKQRLDTLESFMPQTQIAAYKNIGKNIAGGSDWRPVKFFLSRIRTLAE
ncbi:hypothetical protein CIHG_10017 [Coccidioides immitis H538.4]|uniref:Uncharacterized protein n=2 Tax=Coccidioides immitis TaxID=5501 RepID=A0A0J8S5Q0_COCIT|nr:hypothetical protein CIRG_05093 [Coccidioides immitis RMSCC 2394]KMU92156.1 hypothetical protein CIHG_10017 [Coccidioides immitis H538.4]